MCIKNFELMYVEYGGDYNTHTLKTRDLGDNKINYVFTFIFCDSLK